MQLELDSLGAGSTRSQKGAVTFTGGWEDVLRANWRLRTANRVLVELGSWDGSSAESLAEGAGGLVAGNQAWDGLRTSQLFDPRHTVVLRSTAAGSQIRDTRWISLKVKDGIVDAQRRRFGRRSSISGTLICGCESGFRRIERPCYWTPRESRSTGGGTGSRPPRRPCAKVWPPPASWLPVGTAAGPLSIRCVARARCS